MPTDDVTRAGQILSARTLAYPGEQEAWKLTLDRILKERIPPTFAEDQRRAADEWVEFTGSPMPTTNDEWVEAAIRFGFSTDRAIDGNFTPRNVVTAMLGMRARQQDAAGAQGAKAKSDAPEAWLSLAMLAVQRHSGWADSKIAEEVGVHRSTLSRSPVYATAAALAREPRVSRAGYRDDSGSVVAAVMPASLPVDGDPIAGSRYFRATCAGCGDLIRVPLSERENPRCEGCSE